jgi:group I intron endonuclease
MRVGGIIYLITNVINGHRYIGQTVKTRDRRWSLHKAQARTKCTYPLYRAMRKYGFDNFKIETLATVSIEGLKNQKSLLNDLEKLLIKTFQTRTKYKHGYNASPGGDGPGSGEEHPWHGKKHSEETKKKQSKTKLGPLNPMYGKTTSDIQKQSASMRFKGKSLTAEHRAKIAASHTSANPSIKALEKRAWKAKKRFLKETQNGLPFSM